MPRYNAERRNKPLSDKQILRLIRARAADQQILCACGNYYTSHPCDSYTRCDIGHARKAN